MSDPRRDHDKWWHQPEENKHEGLFEWTRYVARQMSAHRSDVQTFVSVATNFSPTGNNEEYGYAIRSAFRHKIRDNIIQPAIATAVSLVAMAKTAPQYITSGGDWNTSRKAEKKSRVLQGQLYDLGAFAEMPRAFKAACEAGTGYVCVTRSIDNKPQLERCLHNEVYVDPEDGRYGLPEVIARVRFIDRDKLYAECGDDEALRNIVSHAGGPVAQDYTDFFMRRDNRADLVRVVEGWRLPTVDNGDDGVYVKAVSSGTLIEKVYTRRRHRVVRTIYTERDQGYHGIGITEQMLPAQMQLAEMDAYISQCQRLGSTSKWFVDRNSGVTRDQITNAAVEIIEVNAGSAPPTLVTSSATPPDLAQQRDAIKRDAYEAQGFGDNTVTGDVNKGLASGEAVRRADDVKVRRFINACELLQGSYEDLVYAIEDTNDECAEIDPSYTVNARQRSGSKTWFRAHKWKDLQFGPDDSPSVQMFPISGQATTASDKFERVKEWVDQGWVSKAWAMDLNGMPDTEAFESLENANLDLVREQLDNLIDLEDAREELLWPVENQDLELAAYLVNLGYLKVIGSKAPAPDEIHMRFTRYLAKVRELQSMAQKPVVPAANAPAALDQNAAAAMAANQQAMAGQMAA